MTTTTSSPSAGVRSNRAEWVLFLIGGLAFFVGGGLHPKGGDSGDKTQQLHSMLVDPLWYPAHAVSLLAMSCIAAGIVGIARRDDLPPLMARIVRPVAVVALVGAVGAVVHLFAATQASATEDGGTSFLVLLFTGVETFVNPVWGLAMATLAVAGGLTHTLGNRIVLALGLLGGIAFAVATATIAFTDIFDPLFPVASLLGIWGVAVGVVGLVRH